MESGTTGEKNQHVANPPWRRIYVAAIIVALTALAIRLPMMVRPGFPPDTMQFVYWGWQANEQGVESLYSIRPSGKRVANYPPAYLYVLKGLAKFFDAVSPADEQLTRYTVNEVSKLETNASTNRLYFLLKSPAVLADAATAGLLVLWISRRTRWQTAALTGISYALWPAVWYNSAVWGQVDAIPTLLMLASLEAAARRRISWMIIWAALAMLFKAQAAMLIPIWATAALYQWRQKPQQILIGLGGAILLVALAMWPVRDQLDGVWAAYAGAAKYYPYTHLNGFSLWFWLDPLDKQHLNENLNKFYVGDSTWGMLGLPPRLWGMILLGATWIYSSIVLWRRRVDYSSLLWAACLLPLAFFCFSTQMHERYLFPAVALWAWAARPTWDWWLAWCIIGLVAWLNPMWVWEGPVAHVEWLSNRLHTQWLGILPGVWCAAGLGIVLIWTLIISRREFRTAGVTAAMGNCK